MGELLYAESLPMKQNKKSDFLPYLQSKNMILKRKHPEHGEIQCSIAEISHGFIAVNGFKDWVQVDRITYSVSNEPEIEETIQVEKKRLVIQKQPWLQAGDPPIETTVEETYYEEEKNGNKIPNPNYVDTSDLNAVYKWLAGRTEFNS